jgi:hypothetical protein
MITDGRGAAAVLTEAGLAGTVLADTFDATLLSVVTPPGKQAAVVRTRSAARARERTGRADMG